MLPYALAIIVGLSSSVLFLTAFLLRDIHRQDDFFWSGLGLFYALVLWFCATSITGAVLLGQLAVVALLTAYFWQVIKLREAIAHPEKLASLDNFSVVGFFKNLIQRSPSKTTPVAEVAKAGETEIKSQEDIAPVAEVTTDQVIENKNDLASAINQVPEIETQPTTTNEFPVAAPKAKPPLTKNESLGKLERETTPLTTAKSNEEILKPEAKATTKESSESSDSTVATPSPTEISADNPLQKVEPPTTEAKETKITEITVEKVTIVEEESNWDDEAEDVPASAVKVIKEVDSLSKNQETKDQETNNTTESSEELN